MRSRVLILIIAIVLGLLAAVTASRYLNRARSQIEAEAQPIAVLVAQQDLSPGMSAQELLDKKLISTSDVPRMYVSDGAVSSPAVIEGQVLAVPVSKGEQITSARFRFPTEAGLAFAIPKDYVAVSIPNDAVRGVTGLVRPGDFVMVLSTFSEAGEDAEPVTKVLLPKARVIAVGSSMTPQQPGETVQTRGGALRSGGSSGASTEVPGTITLALSPAEVERLVFAEEQGSVWLGLLSSTSTGVSPTKGVKLSDVVK